MNLRSQSTPDDFLMLSVLSALGADSHEQVFPCPGGGDIALTAVAYVCGMDGMQRIIGIGTRQGNGAKLEPFDALHRCGN